jgi:short-subunit dehydrogenase
MRAIVITGASSGLGAALAISYAAPGLVLGLVARNRKRLEEVGRRCREAGAETELLDCDVAEAEPLGSWLLALDQRAPIELLIVNAGTSGGPGPGIAHEGLESVTRMLRTNLLGAANTVEPLLPALVRRGEGKIAIIAAVAALRGLPYCPGYSASKAGMRAYGEALRGLLAPSGIQVTVACPGFFSSPMTDRWRGPTPFLWSLDKATRRMRRGIDRGASRIMFPFWLALGTRLADLLPPWLGDIIMRNFRFHIVARE